MNISIAYKKYTYKLTESWIQYNRDTKNYLTVKVIPVSENLIIDRRQVDIVINVLRFNYTPHCEPHAILIKVW